MRAYAWRGSAAEQALFAILIMAGFVPMLWSGQEAGREAFYQRILRARAASAALLSGERAFNVVGCSHPDAFSVVCRAPNETVWGVVSLHAERTPLRFSLPPEAVRAGAAGFRLFDLIERTLWTEHGRPIWVPRAAPDLTISLVPFLPYFFRIEGSPA
jgi:hypothetical protein